jgi:hypothetical protein
VRWKLEAPDHRIKALEAEDLRKPSRSKDPVERSVADGLRDVPTTPDEVRYALSVYRDPWQKEVLETFLLAAASAEIVEDVLGIPQSVYNVYAAVFFQIDVFRNRLDVESYALNYPKTHDNGFGQELKLKGVTMGLHYICAMFGRGSYKLPHQEVMEDMVSQAFMFAKISYNTPRTSQSAKEARQWGSNFINAVRSIPDIRDSMRGDTSELRIRLKLVTESTSDIAAIDADDIVFDNSGSDGDD